MDNNLPASAGAIYVREDAEAIIWRKGAKRHLRVDYLRIDERGVWIALDHDPESPEQEALRWHPQGELESAPNLLGTPILPFPFSAAQLAAFMLDGAGAHVREMFGNWSDGPDEVALIGLDPLANGARDVLRSAFSSYRAALTKVEPLEPSVQQRATVLHKFLDKGFDEANERVSIGPGTTADDYSARHARAIKLVEFLLAQAESAAVEADDRYRAWRMAMTRALLTLPAPMVALRKVAAPSEPPRAVPRQLAQEKAILAKLAELGFDPMALSLTPGKPSEAKQAVQRELGLTAAVMRKAWQRLRNDGRIAEA